MRSLETRDLDETVEKEKVVAVLTCKLGKSNLKGLCRLNIRFGGTKTARNRPVGDAAT